MAPASCAIKCAQTHHLNYRYLAAARAAHSHFRRRPEVAHSTRSLLYGPVASGALGASTRAARADPISGCVGRKQQPSYASGAITSRRHSWPRKITRRRNRRDPSSEARRWLRPRLRLRLGLPPLPPPLAPARPLLWRWAPRPPDGFIGAQQPALGRRRATHTAIARRPSRARRRQIKVKWNGIINR